MPMPYFNPQNCLLFDRKWRNFGTILKDNCVFAHQRSVRIWFQALQMFLISQLWLWNASEVVWTHTNWLFGHNYAKIGNFAAKSGRLLDRNGCHGITMTCGIPLPVSKYLAYKLIESFNQFPSKLNVSSRLIMTIIVRQLLILCSKIT